MKTCSHIQSFISNISFPKTLQELQWFATEQGCFNIEDILYDDIVEWTVPTWAKIGDVVFFMHAKTAKTTITKLRTELKNSNSYYTKQTYNLLMSWLERGLALYSSYGGKIFALGIVRGLPSYDSFGTDEGVHWHSRIYARIEVVSRLKYPIDISEFNDFIKVSRQSAITPVLGKDFSELRKRIATKNKLPLDIWNLDAAPLPLTKVNDENWFELTNEYRRSFFLEMQFRHFYVDYLLKGIGDQKTIFSECRCIKPNHPDTFADNVILIGGKYLPVEVKLSINTQKNIKAQVRQYCDDAEIVLNSKNNRRVSSERVYNQFVLIVDTDELYIYNNTTQKIEPIYSLDNLIRKTDLTQIRENLLLKIE